MLFCSSHAKFAWLFPGVGTWLKTRLLQFELTEPVALQSSMLITMRPTIHNTKNMKAPMMTMEGSSRLCDINHNRMPRNPIVRADTVMTYGKYLHRVWRLV